MANTPKHWDVEDNAFWESTGKSIANRNLWVSIPNLLCGFSVWLYWGMIVKIMQRLHFANPELFNFTFRNQGQPYDEAGYRALLFTLPAVAGLAGATLRIPNSFMIAICGGRNVKFMTTVMLIVPALATGVSLRNPDTPFGVYILLAALSGVGGGAFASSMSNISFFFPKRMQGLALGSECRAWERGRERHAVSDSVGHHAGAVRWRRGMPQEFVQDGVLQRLWIQNAAFIWVPVMTVLAIAAWLFMNNLPQHDCGPTPVAIGKYLWLQLHRISGNGGRSPPVDLCSDAWSGTASHVYRVDRRGGGHDVGHAVHDTTCDPDATQQAVRHFLEQTQLGHDLVVRHDVRIVYWILQRISETDGRCVRNTRPMA